MTLVVTRSDMSALWRKAIAGFIQLELVLALLLFLPAWSLRFWQAWLYWALFSVSVLFITLYFLRHDPRLIERRLAAGPASETEKNQKIIQAVAAVLTCIVFLVAGFDHRFHWSSVPPAAVVAGDLFTVIGLAIVFRVFQENSYTASTIHVEADQRVVSTGPYAWVRHPMYAGSLLAFLGTPVALGSLWTLVPSTLVCGVIIVRLLDEERFLSQHLAGYDAYCRNVPYRLIPHLW